MVYFIFGVFCWFYFYHHPEEQELEIKDEPVRSSSDYTRNRSSNALDIVTPGYTRYAAPNEIFDPSKNLEVTLLDALRIKDISLLIVSFLIRETHNKYVLVNSNYKADSNIDPIYY